MSVIKMIVADDQHYVAGELHDSSAQCVYAACSHNPKSLDELDKLLPEFGTDPSLREHFHRSASLELEPLEAGLIVVDLAKKWIFADVTGFSAGRRGRYERGDHKGVIEYEFSSDWQFVAEAKWFRYLHSANLTPHANRRPGVQYVEFTWEDLMKAREEYEAQRNKYYEACSENLWTWDEDLGAISRTYANRSYSLTEMNLENVEEELDLRTLERILEHDEKVAINRHRVEKTRSELTALRNEWQVPQKVESPYGYERAGLNARIKNREKHISICQFDQKYHQDKSAELRKLMVTERFRALLQAWDEGQDLTGDDGYKDLPW